MSPIDKITMSYLLLMTMSFLVVLLTYMDKYACHLSLMMSGFHDLDNIQSQKSKAKNLHHIYTSKTTIHMNPYDSFSSNVKREY